MLRCKGFTQSDSDENGQIADAIWYLSLIPHHKCPWQEISMSLCTFPHTWCDQDDPGRGETQKVSGIGVGAHPPRIRTGLQPLSPVPRRYQCCTSGGHSGEALPQGRDRRLSPSCYSCLYSLWNMKLITCGWGVFHNTWKSYGILLSVSIDKGVLTYNRAHLYTVCGCFCTSRAELRNCNRDCIAHRYLLCNFL